MNMFNTLYLSRYIDTSVLTYKQVIGITIGMIIGDILGKQLFNLSNHVNIDNSIIIIEHKLFLEMNGDPPIFYSIVYHLIKI